MEMRETRKEKLSLKMGREAREWRNKNIQPNLSRIPRKERI